MPRRTERTSCSPGFTLVEAVIVIAIMAILASAAVPLLIRALSQQRETQTRGLVKAAYEALVGARDRAVPNLATDVGFVPPAALADLRFLTIRTPAAAYLNGAIPPQYPTAATGFNWGWNGPYWSTPIQSQAGTNGLPADGWGRPLRWQANQVQSAGADGVFGTTDDVVYPPAPAPTAVQRQATVQVVVERQVNAPLPPATLPSATFTVQVTDRNQQVLRPITFPIYNVPASDSRITPALPQPPLNLMPGAVFIQVTCVLVPGGTTTQSQTIVVTPGEARIVSFRFNQ